VWRRRSRGASLASGVAADVAARAGTGRGPMTLGDLAAHAMAATASATGAGAAAWRRYVAACAAYGDTPPAPFTPAGALGFALCECLRGINSSGLSAAVAAALRHAEDTGVEMQGWNDAGRRTVSRGLRALAADFPAEVVRARPMTDEVMLAVHAYLGPFLARGDVYARMWWAMLTTAYAGCLRSIEFLGDALTPGQLSVSSVAGGRDMLELDLPFRKTSRNERDAEMDRVTLPPRPPAERLLDPLPAMRAYLVAAGLELGTGDEPLFERRRRDPTGTPWPESAPCYSYAASLRELRWLLRKAGPSDADAGTYAWHSCRRGMATHLLAMGVPWGVVKKLGSWAADASLANYDARARRRPGRAPRRRARLRASAPRRGGRAGEGRRLRGNGVATAAAPRRHVPRGTGTWGGPGGPPGPVARRPGDARSAVRGGGERAIERGAHTAGLVQHGLAGAVGVADGGVPRAARRRTVPGLSRVARGVGGVMGFGGRAGGMAAGQRPARLPPLRPDITGPPAGPRCMPTADDGHARMGCGACALQARCGRDFPPSPPRCGCVHGVDPHAGRLLARLSPARGARRPAKA